MQIGYKIVRFPQLTSCIATWEDVVVYYPLWEWVAPQLNRGPLCVFRTLQDAQRWCCTVSFLPKNLRIFKCYFEESDETSIWGVTAKIELDRLPHGTALADRVKLIERVTW